MTHYQITSSENDIVVATTMHVALVMTVDIEGHRVRRVLMDNRSFADILYFDAFRRMGLSEAQLMPTDSPLVRFNGGMVYHLGSISLDFQMGNRAKTAGCLTNSLLGKVPSPYNTILRRPTLNARQAVRSWRSKQEVSINQTLCDLSAQRSGATTANAVIHGRAYPK